MPSPRAASPAELEMEETPRYLQVSTTDHQLQIGDSARYEEELKIGEAQEARLDELEKQYLIGLRDRRREVTPRVSAGIISFGPPFFKHPLTPRGMNAGAARARTHGTPRRVSVDEVLPARTGQHSTRPSRGLSGCTTPIEHYREGVRAPGPGAARGRHQG